MFDIGDELLKLDNQICFKLYAASRAMTRAYRPLLEQLHITYPQYLVLLVLWEWHGNGENGQHTLKDIGQRLFLDSGTLTPLIKRLEGQHLIQRHSSDADGREIMISLTQEGIELKQQAVSVPQQLLCQFNVDLEQLAQMHHSLGLLLNQLSPPP